MSIEAMKQALEALECSVMIGQRQEDAIATLRAAITEQEKVEHSLIDVWCECCGYMTYHREHMGCILKAHHAPVPAGWQLVPVEPTPEMLDAGEEAIFQSRRRDVEFKAKTGEVPNISSAPNMAYKAMLAAAPKPGEMK